MGDDLIPTVIALIALFLSSMQGRVATVLARGDSSDDRSFGAYMPMVILGGFLGVAIWVFRAWTWYWPVAVFVGFSLASGPFVNLSNLGMWMVLRVPCAIVIVAAAVVLWVVY